MKPTLQITTLAFLALVLISMPAIVRAASTSDNNNSISPSTSDSNNNSTSSATQDSAMKMFLTAVPEKGIISRGTTETIDISAKTDNGTAIPDVNIQSIVVDYASTHQKVILGGQTDDKGELKVSTAIGPHAHAGQFLVSVEGTHANFDKSVISTGFAVVNKGSSSDSGSSSTDSKGRCSGSSCR